uniref:Uncharacterized protein n=1 Tax=viral metagenome TaxID=1070528 RepID=A0A6C0LXQ3_9ZZZZ
MESITTEIQEFSSQSDVLPFCVYHFVDKKKGIFRGYIAPPNLESGSYNYECGPPPSPTGWVKKFEFYAINPMVRPIPYGMSLFCANKRMSEPYDTNEIKFTYDPYNISGNCVYFIAYTKAVEYSIPIFTHVLGDISGDIVFPSLDPNPPVHSKNNYLKRIQDPDSRFTVPHYEFVGDSSRTISESVDSYQPWERGNIFPFFVLSPAQYGPKYWEIKFTCSNGRCLPYLPGKNITKPIISSGSLITNQQPRKLSECVINCNIAVPEFLGGGEPYNLIGIINKKINTYYETTSPITMSITVCVLIVLIGVIVCYPFFKK